MSQSENYKSLLFFQQGNPTFTLDHLLHVSKHLLWIRYRAGIYMWLRPQLISAVGRELITRVKFYKEQKNWSYFKVSILCIGFNDE